MKYNRICTALAIGLTGAVLYSATALAGPLTLEFKYPNGPHDGSYGTMEISVLDADSLQIRFAAINPNANPAIDFEVTGFGFDFNPEMTSLTVSNPANGDFAGDQDDLIWIKLGNLSAFPNPANTGNPPNPNKDAFEFGVTEGNANNLNPPGIEVGEFDIFYLNGFNGLTDDTDLLALIDFAAIRIQSLPDNINGGSLFLVGTPVDDPGGDPGGDPLPEPGTLTLLGTALLGLGLLRRRRKA